MVATVFRPHPIALAAGVAVRTLQEFLAFFQWDEERAGQVHRADTHHLPAGSVPTDRTYCFMTIEPQGRGV